MHKPIVRLLVLVVLLANQLMLTLGYEPFPVTEEQLYEFFSTVVLGIVAFWTYWKNNPFTKEAIETNELMESKKRERKKEVNKL